MGHAYTKKLDVVHLKFKFNWMSCIFGDLILSELSPHNGWPPSKLLRQRMPRMSLGEQTDKAQTINMQIQIFFFLLAPDWTESHVFRVLDAITYTDSICLWGWDSDLGWRKLKHKITSSPRGRFPWIWWSFSLKASHSHGPVVLILYAFSYSGVYKLYTLQAPKPGSVPHKEFMSEPEFKAKIFPSPTFLLFKCWLEIA